MKTPVVGNDQMRAGETELYKKTAGKTLLN